jgi:hypothetical protein
MNVGANVLNLVKNVGFSCLTYISLCPSTCTRTDISNIKYVSRNLADVLKLLRTSALPWPTFLVVLRKPCWVVLYPFLSPDLSLSHALSIHRHSLLPPLAVSRPTSPPPPLTVLRPRAAIVLPTNGPATLSIATERRPLSATIARHPSSATWLLHDRSPSTAPKSPLCSRQLEPPLSQSCDQRPNPPPSQSHRRALLLHAVRRHQALHAAATPHLHANSTATSSTALFWPQRYGPLILSSSYVCATRLSADVGHIIKIVKVKLNTMILGS